MAAFNVYYQYSTPQMNGECGDASKDFSNKQSCWQFVQSVRRHAMKSNTTVDLVVYGEFDEATQTAPKRYELFICSEYVRETSYRKS